MSSVVMSSVVRVKSVKCCNVQCLVVLSVLVVVVGSMSGSVRQPGLPGGCPASVPG